MKIAVILSTYNAPVHLERVLAGYSRQTQRDFEVCIADDGSGEPTRRLIEGAQARFGFPVRHVWHEDIGFRKCTILNRAIEACDGDYLVFSDGDCIPREDFLATHAALARKGWFLSGGYLKLPKDVTEALSVDDVLAGKATSYPDLRSLGLPAGPRMAMRLTRSEALARLFDAMTPTSPTWNGHNASCWKSDSLRVKGFDERMVYGSEDREFGERLWNAGLQSTQIRFRAPVAHLWHTRGYVTEEGKQANRKIFLETRRLRSTATAFGLGAQSAR